MVTFCIGVAVGAFCYWALTEYLRQRKTKGKTDDDDNFDVDPR
jgi:hypothetical protein